MNSTMICNTIAAQLPVRCLLASPCQRTQAPVAARQCSHSASSFLRPSTQLSHCAALRPRSAAAVGVRASGITITEPSSGTEFPLARTFWVGDVQRALGAAVRSKKFAFIGVKVYAVALFVEADKAAKELGVRERGGFFTAAPDSDYALAIIDGAFAKSLVIKLVRKVESEQFVGAIAEALEPRLRLSGEMSTLEKFRGFFQAKQSLEKGTTVTMLWRPEGVLELLLRESDDGVDYARTQPDERIESQTLCRALFEIYLGGSPVIPEAIGTWAAGTKKLLDSENEKRNTRRS